MALKQWLTSWVSRPRFLRVQVSPPAVVWWRGPLADRSLLRYQPRSGWPGCRKHASQGLLPPAGTVVHCTALFADNSARPAHDASPASHVPLSHTCVHTFIHYSNHNKKPEKDNKEKLCDRVLPFWQVTIFLCSWWQRSFRWSACQYLRNTLLLPNWEPDGHVLK